MKGPPARHEEQQENYPAVEGIIADAKELRPDDRVVYPNQGVCRITGIETKEIAGQKLELVRMEREEDGAAVLVPRAKVPTVGLRKVASRNQIEGVFHYLAASFDDPELDWKVRHRDNADRLIAGGVLGVAEVVKGLHSLSRIRPLPTKEREQYDNARHLLVHEVAVSLAAPPALAEDYIDFALMPPEGVRFELRPPPKPVALPVRPRRRVVRPAAESEEEDLGLDDLGLDLGAELEIGGAAPAVPVDLGAVLGDTAGENGEGAAPIAEPEAEDEGGDEEEAEKVGPPRKAAAPPVRARKAEKAATKKKPEKSRPEKAAPASKSPAKKAAKPAAAKAVLAAAKAAVSLAKAAVAKKAPPKKPAKPQKKAAARGKKK